MASSQHGFTKGVAVLVAALALAAPAAAAGAKVLVATYNEGLEPHVQLQGHSRVLERPKQITVEVTGGVQGDVNARFRIECRNHKVTGLRKRYSMSGYTPATRTVKIKGSWDDCRVMAADARYDDPFIEGWIQIRAFGKSR